MNERKAITDWLRSRRASEPMRLTVERLADLIDQGKHLERGIEWNPHVDNNGNCVNCGTGQLNFDERDTGCACSRVADAEYEAEQRIIKLLESYANAKCDEFCAGWCDCFGKFEAETFIALIKGENK